MRPKKITYRFPKNVIRKIGKNEGFERITDKSLDVAVIAGEDFYKNLFQHAKRFMLNAKRKTLLDRDIKDAWEILKKWLNLSRIWIFL